MDNRNAKYITQLVNTHKIASIVTPLMEAVEINKRSGSIEGLSVPALLKQVLEAGDGIYQDILDSQDDIVENGLVADKVLLILAKSLRNSIVLYNTPSLSLMKDELKEIVHKNTDFIQSYQNLGEKLVSSSKGRGVSLLEERQIAQYSMGYVLSALSQMCMPIWLFHTNLYTSNMVDTDKMVNLNRDVSTYMINVMKTMVERIGKSQGKLDEGLKANTLFMCSEICASVLYNYHLKLVKNKSSLEQYLQDPISLVSTLVPALYANLTVLNETVGAAVSELLGE